MPGQVLFAIERLKLDPPFKHREEGSSAADGEGGAPATDAVGHYSAVAVSAGDGGDVLVLGCVRAVHCSMSKLPP